MKELRFGFGCMDRCDVWGGESKEMTSLVTVSHHNQSVFCPFITPCYNLKKKWCLGLSDTGDMDKIDSDNYYGTQ